MNKTRTITVKQSETEKDIAFIAGNLLARGAIQDIGDSREFILDTIPEWAEEFEAGEGTLWETEDYLEAIEVFAERKLREGE